MGKDEVKVGYQLKIQKVVLEREKERDRLLVEGGGQTCLSPYVLIRVPSRNRIFIE